MPSPRHRRRKKLPRGFSLIETMIVIIVLILLATAIAQMTIASVRFFAQQDARTGTQRAAGIGIEPIREAAETAKTIVASRTINGTAYTSSSSTVVFELPSVDSSGNLLLTSSDFVAFARSAANPTLLVRDTSAAAGSARATRTDVIAPFVAELRFRYNTSTPVNATTVEIYLETTQDYRGFPQRTPISSLIRLRNK